MALIASSISTQLAERKEEIPPNKRHYRASDKTLPSGCSSRIGRIKAIITNQPNINILTKNAHTIAAPTILDTTSIVNNNLKSTFATTDLRNRAQSKLSDSHQQVPHPLLRR